MERGNAPVQRISFSLQFIIARCPASLDTLEMFKTIFLSLSFALALLAQDDSTENILAWKLFIKAENLGQLEKIFDVVELANQHVYQYDGDGSSAKDRKAIYQVLSRKAEAISSKELLALKRVRSIQVGKLGAYKYSFFKCNFKQKPNGLFFEKTTGSQRRSGFIYPNDANSLVFLGGSSVNNDPQNRYSGLSKNKQDTEHDTFGYLIKRQGKIFAVFHRSSSSYEVYEFTK